MFFSCKRDLPSLFSLLILDFSWRLSALSFRRLFMVRSVRKQKEHFELFTLYTGYYYRNSGENDKNKRFQPNCFQNVSRNCLHLLFSEVNTSSLFDNAIYCQFEAIFSKSFLNDNVETKEKLQL